MKKTSLKVTFSRIDGIPSTETFNLANYEIIDGFLIIHYGKSDIMETFYPKHKIFPLSRCGSFEFVDDEDNLIVKQVKCQECKNGMVKSESSIYCQDCYNGFFDKRGTLTKESLERLAKMAQETENKKKYYKFY